MEQAARAFGPGSGVDAETVAQRWMDDLYARIGQLMVDLVALMDRASRADRTWSSGQAEGRIDRLELPIRGLSERITIGRYASGAIAIDVRGAFAGVLRAATSSSALNGASPRALSRRGLLSVVAGARNQLEVPTRG